MSMRPRPRPHGGRRLAAAALLVAVATTGAAQAAVKVDGTVFPDTLMADGRTLALNGVGVRVFFHIVDGYATALYLARPAHTEAAVIATPNPKAVLSTFFHAASIGQVRDESAGIHRRFCAATACSASDQASYATFMSHLAPAHPGETQLIVVTDTGVDIIRDNQKILTIPDPAFGQNLIRSLLGAASPTAHYRNGLLGVTG